MRPRATSTTAYDDLAHNDDDDGDDFVYALYDDDGSGTLPAMRRDQGQSHRDLRCRRSEARDRGQDREMPADTGTCSYHGQPAVLFPS